MRRTRSGIFRRRRRRRRAFAIVLVAVVAITVVVVTRGPAQVQPANRAATGGSTGSGSSAGSSGAARSGSSTGSPRSASGRPPTARVPAALARLHRQETAAIDAILRYTPVVASGGSGRREVALTFDDGPSQYTPRIMRILLQKRVPATFFVVGQQLNRYTPELRAELGNAFHVGDHTENHQFLGRLRPAGQWGQINDAAVRLRGAGAPFPRLFRPPYGSYNPATFAALGRLNMLMVLWSIDPQDWRRPGTGVIIHNVLAGARPGAIVLMHDGGGYRDQTVAALPAIIDGLRRRHFHLVSVPRLLLDDPPPRHQRLPHQGGG